MPNIDETRTAKSLGLNGNHRRVWRVCPQCGDGAWITKTVQKRPGYTGLCHSCNASARGGKRVKAGYRWVNSNGYVLIKLQPDDFFYPMTGKDGYVLEHRLVMARRLKRCLHSWEIVHHRNHKRGDNRIENLQLVSDDKHKQISILEAKIKRIEKKLKDNRVDFVIILQQVLGGLNTNATVHTKLAYAKATLRGKIAKLRGDSDAK